MKKVSKCEITCYSIASVIAVTGLTFLVMALIGSFCGTSGNNLEVFFIPGYACFPSGGALLALFLVIFANTNDKALEQAARRAARLAKTPKKAEPKAIEDLKVNSKENPTVVLTGVEAARQLLKENGVPCVEDLSDDEVKIMYGETEIVVPEEPKVEEPVVEAAPVEEAPVEETPVEEPKAEEAPAEEPKVEEPAPEEPKAE